MDRNGARGRVKRHVLLGRRAGDQPRSALQGEVGPEPAAHQHPVTEADQIEMCTTAQASQATKPVRRRPRMSATAELRPMVAMLPRSR